MMCRYFHNKEIEKILSNPQKVARKNVKFENFVISAKIVKSASLLEGCVVIYITNWVKKNLKSAEGFNVKS